MLAHEGAMHDRFHPHDRDLGVGVMLGASLGLACFPMVGPAALFVGVVVGVLAVWLGAG